MHFPTREGQNGGTATHLVTFLIFGSFLTRDIVFLCCTETKVAGCQCPCVAMTRCPCVAITQSSAGGRRAVAPTLTPLVFPPPTHPHPELLSPCWGGGPV